MATTLLRPVHTGSCISDVRTPCRVLDVVAVSSEDYKIWLNGLQLLLDLGGTNANRVGN